MSLQKPAASGASLTCSVADELLRPSPKTQDANVPTAVLLHRLRQTGSKSSDTRLCHTSTTSTPTLTSQRLKEVATNGGRSECQSTAFGYDMMSRLSLRMSKPELLSGDDRSERTRICGGDGTESNSESELGDDEGYETPQTSPETSPIKTMSLFVLQKALEQVDGLVDDHSEPAASDLVQRRPALSRLQTSDRFIPSRTDTPTKEIMLSTIASAKLTDSEKRHRGYDVEADPFGPAVRRSIRMAEQYATLCSPAAPLRPVLGGTSVNDAETSPRRAVSTGTVWTVGGTAVTEGVASTTNSRGGRITSGTSAPHYAADFLRRDSRGEEEKTHGRRLALAMDIDQTARMIGSRSTSPLSSPVSGSAASTPLKRTFWRDCTWQHDLPASPTKPRPQKAKDIPIIPFRVLDAPALRDDYYCSPLAYSYTVQCLAVALGPHVHLWSENRSSFTTIPDSLNAPSAAHITSVSFSSTQGGSAILAIGRADGRISLWSPYDGEPRLDSEHPAPVSCIAFRPTTVKRPSIRETSVIVNAEELLAGDEVGNVYFYSVEWPNEQQRDLFGWHGSMTLLARISCHTQQICGIAWSTDGESFATGGNDNQLFVFETKKILSPPTIQADTKPAVHLTDGSSSGSLAGQGEVLSISSGQARHVFTLNAAVKAVAISPWQSSLIAAGGGSNDRCIHFFHTLSGAALATIDCHAQVTSLVWSERKKEIAATFGFAQPEHPYRVAVFTWPGCRMVVGIPWWSEERALYAVAYPGGPSGGPAERSGKATAEGGPWYGRRTREEGCLVVATSDASIKFHEVWAERTGKVEDIGLLGGSQILEGECSAELQRVGLIR